MSLTINTNLSSLIAQSSLKSSTKGLNQTIERMTTGYKINHAKDNAAGYSIATNMSTKISALSIAEENASMGLDYISSKSSILDQMSDLVSRLRALATQAQNGTYGSDSIDAINTEADAILAEYYRLCPTEEKSSSTVKTNGFVKEIQRRDTSTMTKLESVSESSNITSGTYSISTSAGLEKLAKMTNNGLISAGVEFVLANNIDISSYSNWTPIGCVVEDNSSDTGYKRENTFQGIFDGNGYEISGLSMSLTVDYSDASMTKNYGMYGLFGLTQDATIKNLGVTRTNIKGSTLYMGALVGFAEGGSVTNCYSTGSISVKGSVTQNSYVGGLVGATSSTIKDSYSSVACKDFTYCGGLVAMLQTGTIENCFSTGNVSGCVVGGLVAAAGDSTFKNSYATGNVTETITGGSGCSGFVSSDSCNINNCYSTGSVISANASDFAGDASGNCTITNSSKVTTERLNELIANGTLSSNKFQPQASTGAVADDGTMTLQIGINSDSSSQISFNSRYDISGFEAWTTIDADNALEIIDDVLAQINARQTEFGAVENRLTSAIESIGVSYDNLVSSRSTLRDADIAQESSSYIKYQILQQASATLMATANQSPAVALQLI